MARSSRVPRCPDPARRPERRTTAADHKLIGSWGNVLSELIEGDPGVLVAVILSDVLHILEVSQAKGSVAWVFGMRSRKIPGSVGLASLVIGSRDLSVDLMGSIDYFFELFIFSPK